MMYLKTYCKPTTTDGTYDAYWRVGENRQGVFQVTGVDIEDGKVAAELFAIQYLILNKNIFNVDVKSGVGIELIVSSPVIKKLLLGKSTKKHLFSISKFLKTKLKGATITPHRDTESVFILTEPNPIDTNEVNYTSSTDFDRLDTPALGQIKLTTHAIDQYKERLHSGDALNPTSSLIKRLSNPDLRKQVIPDDVLRHKLKKYGKVDNTEIWSHDRSKMNYVVLRDNEGIGTVVTVFAKDKEAYMFK